jgi:hypothetical protein
MALLLLLFEGEHPDVGFNFQTREINPSIVVRNHMVINGIW